MMEQYISDGEYRTHFEKLGGLRSRIARDLPFKPSMRMLDVATGEGFFAIEVAKRSSDMTITGIDISQRAIREAIRNVKKENFEDRIEILKMDATTMDFHDGEFDMAINFTGFEEIHLSRGREGVQKTFLEVNRVLKPGSYFCFVVMPSEEMETKAQKIEVALFDYICGAKYLSSKEYEVMATNAKFKLIEKRSYYSGLKFTLQQAKCEIKYVIKNIPKIYGIATPSFNEVWIKFGRDIEENGMGCYSKVVLMVAQKVPNVL